jgi:predicted aspartyl protease
MNKLLAPVVLALGLLVFSPTANTSANSECFLQAPGGRQVDLSRLCGVSPGSAGPARSFRMPILRRVSGIPTVIVIFNDRHRYEMLFDTGASGIVLTETMARSIGVRKEREMKAKTAGGIVTGHLGRVASVSAGDFTLKNPVVSIFPTLEGIGLLGQSFFKGYEVTIKQDVIEFRYSQ